jgi:hypothetical protein
MARGGLPENIYEPSVMPEDLPRKVVPRGEEAMAPIGPALEGAFNAVDRKYQADSAVYAGDQLTQLRQTALASLAKMKDEAPAGDPGNFTERYLADFDKQAQPVTSNPGVQGNVVASSMLNRGISQLRDQLAEHVKGWEANQRVDYRQDAFDTHVKDASSYVEAFPDTWVSNGQNLSAEANAIGGDPARRLTLMRTADAQLSMAAAAGYGRQDPRGVLSALNDPESAPERYNVLLRGLNDQQREAVRAKANEHLGDSVYSAMSAGDIRGAQATLNQNADLMDPRTHAELQRSVNSRVESDLAQSEKLKRDTSNAILIDLIYRSTQGTLTSDYVNSKRNAMEPAAYMSGLDLASGKKTETDPRTFADLQMDYLGGKDVTERAKDAFLQGKVSKQDFVSLSNRDEAGLGGNPAQQGARFIMDSLKPSPGEVGGRFRNAAQDQSNAMEDFRGFLRDNPKADPGQIRDEYHQIVRNYDYAAGAAVLATGAVPLHLVGPRSNPDIAATKAATLAAHQAGAMSDEEFARQQALIVSLWQAQQKTKANKVQSQ